MLVQGIFNGEDAEMSEFPYMASIYDRHGSFLCAGSLIKNGTLWFVVKGITLSNWRRPETGGGVDGGCQTGGGERGKLLGAGVNMMRL